NRVVEPDALATSVADVAAAITANAPLTIAAAKRTVNELLAPESERDMAACRRLMDKCFASADYTEGRRAFAEKRSPRFTGR
ncbi:MAG: enoyl-CoA hydratase-related protein, partial [Alphaproteobacteria bacterium]